MKVEFNNFGSFASFSIAKEDDVQEYAKYVNDNKLSPYCFRCSNIIQSFIIELFELANTENIEIKQCKNCGKYFVPDNRSDEIYCSNIYENEINQILKDKMRFEALVNTKSKSAIGWKEIRPIRHFELIKEIRANYYDSTEKYVKIIKEKLTDERINQLLNKFNNEIISLDMKKLLFKFIVERKNRILAIYDMKDEV